MLSSTTFEFQRSVISSPRLHARFLDADTITHQFLRCAAEVLATAAFGRRRPLAGSMWGTKPVAWRAERDTNIMLDHRQQSGDAMAASIGGAQTWVVLCWPPQNGRQVDDVPRPAGGGDWCHICKGRGARRIFGLVGPVCLCTRATARLAVPNSVRVTNGSGRPSNCLNNWNAAPSAFHLGAARRPLEAVPLSPAASAACRANPWPLAPWLSLA